MTLKQAYRAAISGTQDLGFAHQTMANRRTAAKQGRFPSDKVMRMVCKKAGWKKIADEQWEK